jgi:LuxR family transcriptional regulator, maltose regulon positive regulatory protein
MVSALQREERSDGGGAAPIERPRLGERLAASETCPITLLIAPAGYGKSVALRQYLRSIREPNVRFVLRAEHVTLLAFLRGFTESLRESAPHAITSLAGAYERSTGSAKRAGVLASWLHAHLESFAGVIAIDDLHLADDDPEVARFLTSLIERTKGKIRWILASRSTTGLPVGTWLAYRDADLAIDEQDLRFTLEEAREAAHGLGLAIRDEELTELLTLTEGWPAALTFALRTSTRSSELRNVSALTREMIYRLLAEQVYGALDADERGLLKVAVVLPVIDVSVLERAGFDRAFTIVERLRERTAFIYEESPGIYHCHDLFRDFLRRETALAGKHSQQTVYDRAARALEAGGDVEHAIVSYVASGSSGDVVRLLERHGLDLLERARGDVVANAVEALDEKTRRENASVVALQGALQAIAGKFARAESLLRRAIDRAGSDRDLVATTSLRLASLIGNQGREVREILDPVASDEQQRAAYRAEALSLIAARQAISGDLSAAEVAIETLETLLPDVDVEAARARILHHLGIVNRHRGNINGAFQKLTQASDLASDLHFFSVASRTYAVLSNLSLHEEDDVGRQLQYAEASADAARKAGDAFALQTALLQILSARMRTADASRSLAIEQQLTGLRTDALARRYIMAFRAMRLAWEGRFGEAHELLSTCWAEMAYGVDNVCSGAQYALFLALDGRRDTSSAQVKDVLANVSGLRASGRFDRRAIVICQVFCALAECVNGRSTNADRILRRLTADDPIEEVAVKIARDVLRAVRGRTGNRLPDVTDSIKTLTELGYNDVARLLAAVCQRMNELAAVAERPGILTATERDVLRRLAVGLVPKDIAIETDRSIHTVRVHIANAMAKLDCRGRSEAVDAARRRGLI